jgi:hypothetical protein
MEEQERRNKLYNEDNSESMEEKDQVWREEEMKHLNMVKKKLMKYRNTKRS